MGPRSDYGATRVLFEYPMEKKRPFIAVVDDEEAVRKALARLLRSMDLEADVFPTGESFLASLASSVPLCAVLDLHMPGLTGLDVLKRLHGMTVTFPTIVVTAYDEPHVREQCLSAGAAAYLRKPLDDDLLLRTITHTLGGIPG
jgi:FixJ family two-component response regulator